ncbi:hypothetical protein [uncultured Metabacillus sp.]|uniref:hypothetical protein n=1 Tax=uncultured Metabacillus sp. TaxID=2860135 RepID=UPI00260428BF|nr:hypothetical protein [uncultured Metabacillus sp.]
MKRLLALFVIILCLSGCTEDKPRPEGSVNVIPIQIADVSKDAIEVVSQKSQSPFTIKHHVRNRAVYVECYIPNFIFKEAGGKKVAGEGHLTVYVDGKKVDDMNTAAFVVRGLEQGNHIITVEVVHNDSSSYNLKKTWEVTIQ